MFRLVKNYKTLFLALAEAAVFLICAVYSIAGFSDAGLSFDMDAMQVQDADREVSEGDYLDISYEDAKAVVTPAFSLKNGIYYIRAVYKEHGIVQAGLIYDETRNGAELVDDDEFIISPEDGELFYRVKIKDDSPIRFKLRLTGDAVDGDYIQLLQVDVIPSRLTCVYFLFCLLSFFLILDFLLWGYFKYYKSWEPKQRMIFLILALTAFFVGLPLYQPGLADGADLPFHLGRIEGVYKGLLAGQFPVRIQPDWLDGYGYASSIFYGDIFCIFRLYFGW